MSYQKELAADMAKFWLKDNAIIIDTETTGLDRTDEIVEISAIDCEGNVLMDTLVRPVGEIGAQAQAIHGISHEQTQRAPSFNQVLGNLINICRGRTVVMYNASFDARMIHQSAAHHRTEAPNFSPHCAMNNYARFHGEWDSRREQWKWQSLAKAADQMGVTVKGNAHRALTDCQTTLALIKAMAAYRPHAA